MLDRTIPFYNTILRCDEYQLQQIKLPDGYEIVSYQNGFETDWARLECAVGDFSSAEEALHYFTDTYLCRETDDVLFLRSDQGQVIGSCIAWTDERKGRVVNSLHWLIVDDLYQGKGLGRALCCETMNRFYLHNQNQFIFIRSRGAGKRSCSMLRLDSNCRKPIHLPHTPTNTTMR